MEDKERWGKGRKERYKRSCPPLPLLLRGAGERASNIKKCRSQRREVVCMSLKEVEVKKRVPPLSLWNGTPHLRGSSFTDRRHFHHCRQCIERSLLRGVPGIADP